MKTILAAVLTLSLLAPAIATARPMHHMHKVCTMHHHHKVCRMAR